MIFLAYIDTYGVWCILILFVGSARKYCWAAFRWLSVCTQFRLEHVHVLALAGKTTTYIKSSTAKRRANNEKQLFLPVPETEPNSIPSLWWWNHQFSACFDHLHPQDPIGTQRNLPHPQKINFPKPNNFRCQMVSPWSTPHGFLLVFHFPKGFPMVFRWFSRGFPSISRLPWVLAGHLACFPSPRVPGRKWGRRRLWRGDSVAGVIAVLTGCGRGWRGW